MLSTLPGSSACHFGQFPWHRCPADFGEEDGAAFRGRLKSSITIWHAKLTGHGLGQVCHQRRDFPVTLRDGGPVDTAIKSTLNSRSKAGQRGLRQKNHGLHGPCFAATFGQTRPCFFDPTLPDLTADRGRLSLIRFPAH